MAITQEGARTCHGTTTTTAADSFRLTRKVREVRVTNRDTDPLSVTIVAKRSLVAEADIVTAVAFADETVTVPTGTKVVYRSVRPMYIAGSVIGNASPYSIEGSEHHIGA